MHEQTVGVPWRRHYLIMLSRASANPWLKQHRLTPLSLEVGGPEHGVSTVEAPSEPLREMRPPPHA